MSELRTMTCPTCGIDYGIPQAFWESRYQGRETAMGGRSKPWHCPNGHELSYHETELDRTRKERDLARQQLARAEDERRTAENLRAKAEKELKRHKRRSVAGLCPCCNRSFIQLSRHMLNKHPDFIAEQSGGKIEIIRGRRAAMIAAARKELGA